MSKLAVFGKVSATVMKVGGKALLKCKKASPEILLVGGIACVVGAVVTGIIATKKAYDDEEIVDIQAEIEDLSDELKDSQDKEEKKDIRRALLKKYWKLARKYARKYAIPFALTVAAIVMMLASHGILKTRYLGTVAAYTALDESFKDYRERVKSLVGEEKEMDCYNGTSPMDIIHDDGEGNVTKKTERCKTIKTKASPYEFDFNKGTAPLDATMNTEHNFCFLKAQQCTANDMLHARGHLFLNEVLDLLGMQRTSEGAVLGWLDHGDGDGFVDFGFSDYYTDDISDAMDGRAPNIHLNMNCDGVIFEKI